MTPFAAKLVSSKPCFYHHIFFITGTRISRKNEKSMTLSVLSVLICWSTLRFFVTEISSPCSDLPLQQQSFCKPHRQSARTRAETDQFTLLQLSLQPFCLSSNSKERATANEIKREPALQWICFPTSLMLQLTLAC